MCHTTRRVICDAQLDQLARSSSVVSLIRKRSRSPSASTNLRRIIRAEPEDTSAYSPVLRNLVKQRLAKGPREPRIIDQMVTTNECRSRWLRLTICAHVSSCRPRCRELKWCGRRELNPHGSFLPTDFRTTSACAAAFAFVVWTIPSP